MTHTVSLPFTLLFVASLLLAWVESSAQGPSLASAPGLYSFNNAQPEAVAAYRKGWVEILEYGRWREAERQYRKALAIDPDFVIAMSVLARLLPGGKERQQLEEKIQARIYRVDNDGRLLLDAYVKTLELMNAREQGLPVLADVRAELSNLAATNYRRFLDKYPAEWSVLIEYVEWVHALGGPQRALEEIADLTASTPLASPRGFSYFPAYFYAELDQLEQASALADAFAAGLPEKGLPQPHYIRAFIAFRSLDLAQARLEINRALDLDPTHILAQRLKVQIDAAVDDG